jgi:hypothetical protein
MAYTINLTDGSIFATIADGTINTSSSMILVGKNYAGYGEFLDENFIHLLESGANSTAPTAPLTGQLWWDKTNNVMKVYNGTTFKVISASTASSSAPTSNVSGDLWFDTVNQQLKVWNGTTWILVGPASTSGQGTSGAIVATITDNISVDHVVIQLYVNNTLVGIISKDATFTPGQAISGFATISPGIQLSTTVSNNLFRGTTTNAQLLNSLQSTQFLRSDANSATSGSLGVQYDGTIAGLGGLSVGVDSDFNVAINGSDVYLQNITQNGNIVLRVNDGGTLTEVMSVNGSTSAVSFPTTIAVTGNISGGNISTAGSFAMSGALSVNSSAGATAIINAAGNGVGNVGSSSSYFNRVFATSTSALYADVAERFAADEVLEAGTVVELGGLAEITRSQTDLSENVFGVISTRAAYLMNDGAGDDDTHPPVAMTGRVPVRVVGVVNKGDRLVSAGLGMARAAKAGEASAFNVIGRSLTAKNTQDIGLVEAIVTIK